MSTNCSHDCAHCQEKCNDRKAECFLEQPHEGTKVKKIIGIVSGKGGVGKSLVTGLSAVVSKRKGYKTAIMDADITGPSIPKMFGINGRAKGDENGIIPSETSTGIKIMSLNLLVENPTDPVIWRGPVIAGIVKQFWSDVLWNEVDFMFIDMPPGTGDVPLTVFQSIPVDGIIIVTSPQELVSMIVEKAVNMAKKMNIPILGMVENMSYVECPDCGKKIKVFGESKIHEISKEKNIPVIGELPVQPELSSACDNGTIEEFNSPWMDELSENLLKYIIK